MTVILRGHLAMLLFSALVAGSFSLGALAANEIAPAALNALRFLIAAIVIGVAALATQGLPRDLPGDTAGDTGRAQTGNPARNLTRNLWRYLWLHGWRYLVLGGLFSAYFVLMFQGLKTASPVSTAAVFTLTPLMSAGFGFVLLGQGVTRRMALALSIGAFGALWVIFRADLAAALRFRVGQGEVYYFWGCVAHAIYTPMVRKLNRGETPITFTFGTLVAGFVILTVFGWPDIRATNWAALPAIVWITVFYVAIFASAITFVLLQFAALTLPSAKVMAYTYLVPTWVISWEVALGHGAPLGLIFVGVAMTVAALLLLLRNEH